MKASLGLWSEIRHLMMCIHWTMTQTLRDGDEQSVLCYRSLSWVCCCYNLDVMILQFWVDYFCHYIIDLIIFLSLLISSGVIFLSLQFCCRNSFAMFFCYSFDVIFLSLQFWCDFFVITVLMWRMGPVVAEAWRGPVRPVDCCYRTRPRGGTPSCIARTATTTCPPSPCPDILPYRATCKYNLYSYYRQYNPCQHLWFLNCINDLSPVDLHYLIMCTQCVRKMSRLDLAASNQYII